MFRSRRRSRSVDNRRRAPFARERPERYFHVGPLDLRLEMARLRALPVFAGGALAAHEPELKVRRASKRPHRLGFAIPAEWRLSVTAYPGARPGDLLETLLHELVHLHVGSEPGAHRWHGPEFRTTLARAMEEAYGLTGVRPRGTAHGAYAEALERTLHVPPAPAPPGSAP